MLILILLCNGYPELFHHAKLTFCTHEASPAHSPSPTFCSYTFDYLDGSCKEKSCSACLWTWVGTHLFTIQLSILWHIYPDKGVVGSSTFSQMCYIDPLLKRDGESAVHRRQSEEECSRFVLPFLCVHFLTSFPNLFSVLLLGLVWVAAIWHRG